MPGTASAGPGSARQALVDELVVERFTRYTPPLPPVDPQDAARHLWDLRAALRATDGYDTPLRLVTEEHRTA